MKVNWQAIVDAVAAIYRAFFKGKTIGGVTLPEQGHVPPLRGSKFDSAPHTPGPPK
jgi:hypothetical protein